MALFLYGFLINSCFGDFGEMMIKQDDLLSGVEEERASYATGPVECLGMTFENDDARREHFTRILREKLKDPEFRKIEGFPIGEDEDILNLSDPPYYTACPNPFIEQFVELYGTPYDPEELYSREPYAADVSEGKNDPIYNAHSYHTKVPHKAIMRYILHYTKPGDLVFDGFCGTGMTGVAAQMCGDKTTVESLGYKVLADGTILDGVEDEYGKIKWNEFSKLGPRFAILSDLSPAATYIANNYNSPVDVRKFEKESREIFKEVNKELGWMYRTLHEIDGSKIDSAVKTLKVDDVAINQQSFKFGNINYVVWSDVFVCPECTKEIVFWDVAVNREIGKVKDEFHCIHCQATLTKRSVERAWENRFSHRDKIFSKEVKRAPVLINYSYGTKRFEKTPDVFDLATIAKSNEYAFPYWFPTERMPNGKETRRNDQIGIFNVNEFYTSSSLAWISALRAKAKRIDYSFLVAFSTVNTVSKLYRYVVKKPGYKGQGGGILSGTLYVPSLIRALSVTSCYKRGLSRLSAIYKRRSKSDFLINTSSSTKLQVADNSLDYIFLDPPFGANIYYSELSFLWEAWLKVKTNITQEAIENSAQNKGANEYRGLMAVCFKEAYRILKPGRWITIEFSNTKASVWNSIQTALTESGFIVANVSALDKKQKSFKAITTPTAVKQDLVITAYKPAKDFEERFEKETPEEGVWDFIRNHLKYLPVCKHQAGELVATPERDARILFDQMVVYFVRHGRPVPISSPEFQAGLKERFVERDSMIFLPDQVAEYDKKRVTTKQLRQLSIFVDDEASAIEWLRQQLIYRPMTYQDIHPLFLNELSGWKKNEKPLELRDMLEQNFLQYDGKDEVPSQIHSYLSTDHKDMRNLAKTDPKLMAKAKDRWYVPDPNKAADLEKLRERSLLKEFETYKQASKKIKQPRGEALRAGFKKAWEVSDFQQILDIAGKIPEAVLQEDEKLLMYYDNARSMGGDDDFDWG